MSGTRALFASIGASVSLVAAAALSLLAVSAVFAFGGWSDPIAESVRQTAIVLDDGKGPIRATSNKPIVLPARPQAAARREGARVTTRPQPSFRAADRAGITDSARSRPPKASYRAPQVAAVPAQPDVPAAAPAAPRKSAGDGVRTAGEDLSGKVRGTADALAQITDPLLPPVAAATQKVLDAVAELLRRSTDGLAGTVDGVLAPR